MRTFITILAFLVSLCTQAQLLYVNGKNADFRAIDVQSITEITFDDEQRVVEIHTNDNSLNSFSTTCIDSISFFSNKGAALVDNPDKKIFFDTNDALLYAKSAVSTRAALQRAVVINYGNGSVTIDGADEDVSYTVSGCTHVTVNSAAAGVKFVIGGDCADGSFVLNTAMEAQIELDGLSLCCNNGPVIRINGGAVTISLGEGTMNRLQSDTEDCAALIADGDIAFGGNGVLEITAERGSAISCGGNVAIEGGEYLLDARFNCMSAETLTINGGYIKAFVAGERAAVMNVGRYVQKGGAIQAEAFANSSTIINCAGDADISGGKITAFVYGATTDATAPAAGIVCGGNMVIAGGSTALGIYGEGSQGIYCMGNIILGEADVTLITSGAGSIGVKAGEFIMNDGKVYIKSNENALYAEALTLNGGSFNAYSATDDVIYAQITQKGGWLFTQMVDMPANNIGSDDFVRVTFDAGKEEPAPTRASFGETITTAKWNENDFLYIYYTSGDERAIARLDIIKESINGNKAKFQGTLINPQNNDEVQLVCTNGDRHEVTAEGFKIDLQHQSGKLNEDISMNGFDYLSASSLRFDYGVTKITIDEKGATVVPCLMKQLFAQLKITDNPSRGHRMAVHNMPSTGMFSWEEKCIIDVGGNNDIIALSSDDAVRYVTFIPFDVNSDEHHHVHHEPRELHLDFSVSMVQNETVSVQYYHCTPGKIYTTQAAKYYSITISDWEEITSIDEILNNERIVNVGGVNWATSNMFVTLAPGYTINSDGSTSMTKPYISGVELYENSEDIKSSISGGKNMGWHMGFDMQYVNYEVTSVCPRGRNDHSILTNIKYSNGFEGPFWIDQFHYGASDCFAYDAVGNQRDDDYNLFTCDPVFALRFFDLTTAETARFSSEIAGGESFGTKEGVIPEVHDIARVLNGLEKYKSDMGFWRTPTMEEMCALAGYVRPNIWPEVMEGRVVPTCIICYVNGIQGIIFSDYDYKGNGWAAQSSNTVFRAGEYEKASDYNSQMRNTIILEEDYNASRLLEDGTIAGNTVFFPVESTRTGTQLDPYCSYYSTSTAMNAETYYVMDCNISYGGPFIKGLDRNNIESGGALRRRGSLLRPVFQYYHQTKMDE